ncbi:MAG: hypothetical protein GY758_27095, partial [Fuerstiella sp.]|nr:hypothetical protein [Fuerstiella sp.]
MKRIMLGAVAAAMMLLDSGIATAGLCGLGGFSSCPTDTCHECVDFAAAKCGCDVQYRTVRKVIWDQQQYTCMKTVYDRCTETVPVSYTRNVYQTCYRDQCYTVCKPVYETCYRCVQQKVCRPVVETCWRTVT